MINMNLNKTNINLINFRNKKIIFTTLFIFIQIQFLMEAAPKGLRWSKELVVIGTFILSTLTFIYSYLNHYIRIKKDSILFINSILIVSLLSMLINQDFIGDNFIFIITIISSFFISNIFTREEYLDGYVNAIIIYSIYSLFATYFLHPMIMNGKFDIFNTYINFLGTPFMDLGGTFVVKWNGVMRNQGIFREPGVYQFFLLVALSIELFYKQISNNKKVLILIITLITTFSTVGLICFISLLIVFTLYKKDKSSLKTLLFIMITLVVIVAIIRSNANLTNLIERAFTKLEEGNENESFIVRFESIFNLIKMSTHNILIGNSFVNGFHYIQNHYNTFGTNDITGTMISFITALGYPIGIWINICFYKFCSCLSENKFISLWIFIILFLSINTQNLVYNSIIWVFIFITYNRKSNKVELKYAKEN